LSLQEPLYDYAFIGMGCANSLILLELERAGLLSQKRILVYEPEQKKGNDRTFCFWLEPNVLQEAGLDQLVSHSWSKVKCNEEAPQFLAGKRYYYLRAEALYAHTSALLAQHQVTFRKEALEGSPSGLAHFVFDSRPPQFELDARNDVQISQSFYGWLVQTKAPIFDPEVFTMMDFSIPQNGHAQFLYVLPFDAQQALIEPTRFGEVLITEKEATHIIEKFLEERNTQFEILEKEQGCIPMSSGVLQNEELPKNWFRTGAGGGQLKPSTGYSFVRSLTDAQQIVKSFSLNEAKLKRRKSPQRFAYYDRLLLKIIAQKPKKGKLIFTKLFQHNAAAKVLNFLDEKSTLLQEFRLMSTLPILLFLNAALLDAMGKFRSFLEKRSVAFYMSSILLIFQYFQLGLLSNIIMIVGLLSIGLPHGALDHLYSVPNRLRIPWRFIGVYLGLGLLLLVVWYFLPYLALIIFLAYTAWHFGQADFEIWKLSSGVRSFFWGVFVLLLILGSHGVETIQILSEMGIEIPNQLYFSFDIGQNTTWLLFILGLLWLFNTSFYSRIIETLIVLILGTWLPLLPAFACYFVFQHSLHGWQHLRQKMKLSHRNMWLQALPFTLGALVLFGAYLYLIQEPNWGQVFIFLSALSFPHVYYMHKSYQKQQ
jgi:lycopene beta-cyclase